MSMKIWHQVLIHKDVHREAAQWCREQFGERWQATGRDNRQGVWAVFWAGIRGQESMYRFRFINESDLMVFILRWS